MISFDLVMETYRDNFMACKDSKLHDEEHSYTLNVTCGVVRRK